jgi:hypothetical protein
MKNETVIGIMGNTQGVNSDAKPNPNAVKRKGRRSCCLFEIGAVTGAEDTWPAEGVEAGAALVVVTMAAAGTSKYPSGNLKPLAAVPLANPNPVVTVFFTGGKQLTSLQT